MKEDEDGRCLRQEFRNDAEAYFRGCLAGYPQRVIDAVASNWEKYRDQAARQLCLPAGGTTIAAVRPLIVEAANRLLTEDEKIARAPDRELIEAIYRKLCT